MIAHPHTLPDGPCPGARTFGITVRNCVRCGALLPDNGDTRMTHLSITLGTIDLSDEEREIIGRVIGRTDGRLPDVNECREFIVQHGIDGIDAAMGYGSE